MFSSRILYLYLLFSWFRISGSFSLGPTLLFPTTSRNQQSSQWRRRLATLHVVGNGDVDTMDIFGSIETMDASSESSPLPPSSFDGDGPLLDVTEIMDGENSLRSSNDTSTSEPFFVTVLEKPIDYTGTQNITDVGVTRRKLFQQGAFMLFSGAAIGGAILHDHEVVVEPQGKPKGVAASTKNSNSKVSLSKGSAKQSTNTATNAVKKIAPVNLTKVAAETSINVTMDCEQGCVSVDSKNFTKIQTKKVPTWYPAFLIPPPKVIKEISNAELLAAATVAGATTEMFRTSLLYPLQTVKTRIQTDVHNFTAEPPRIEDRLVNLGKNVRRHVQEGDLYAGITPTLLISVPATGVYFGVRDVTKRVLAMMPFFNDVQIVLTAALIGDVVSLCFRTPADALALRLQDQNRDVGDWVGDSLKRLPGVIITDLPYLLSKILLGRQFIHGSLSIDQYAEYAIISAVVAAFLTTPFDVARTRILIDSDGDSSNGIDGGSGEGVIRTMIAITKEGRGGIANLYAGWLERVLYLGIGRAWLEPLQIIAYVGIRDTILLEWF